MATKKECDRCNKQWDMPRSDSSYDKLDIETCEIEFRVPEARATKGRVGYVNRPKIQATRELCQDCARYLWNLVANIPMTKEAE